MAAASVVLEVPRDLWHGVLLKLPIKDIVKYRRLSKFHRGLIDSNCFIRNHNKESPVSGNHVIASYVYRDGNSVDYLVDFRRTNTIHRLTPPVKIEKRHRTTCKLVGSCMGILCYEVRSTKSRHILLWNPLTKRSRKIGVEGKEELNLNESVLLHDAVTDDLRLLIMHSKTKPNSFEIYSSNSDAWTDEVTMEEHIGCVRGSPVFVAGTNSIYWFSFNGSSIVGYNLSTRKFTKVIGNTIQSSNMLTLGGNLCIHRNESISRRSKIENLKVWMMKDGSWDQLFNINHSIRRYGDVDPIVFINVNGSDQLVIVGNIRAGPMHIDAPCEILILGPQYKEIRLKRPF